MKKMIMVICICAGISAASFVFAVGSGGGGGSGGAPTCSKDTYTCAEWNDCTLEGVQTRDCTLTDDCEHVTDDSPSWSRTCEPVCRSDGWTCGEWGTCLDGGQTRTCSVWYDCSLVEDPSPTTSRSCGSTSPPTELQGESEPGVSSTTQCDQAVLYDRVLCRLNLAPAGVSRELEMEYLPEACRSLDGEEREECVLYYVDFNACWKYPVGEARFDCAREVLELPEDPTAEHVYYMIAFRFYDLEQRAEAYAEEDVDLEVTAAFVTKVIENKIAFQEAETYEARRALIQKMRDDWDAYLVEARKQLGR